MIVFKSVTFQNFGLFNFLGFLDLFRSIFWQNWPFFPNFDQKRPKNPQKWTNPKFWNVTLWRLSWGIIWQNLDKIHQNTKNCINYYIFPKVPIFNEKSNFFGKKSNFSESFQHFSNFCTHFLKISNNLGHISKN